MKTLILTLTIVIAVFFCTITHAEVPQLIRYQGYITDKNSPPQGLNGDYKMAFSLCTTEIGETSIWEETYDGEDKVSISNGQFSVLLGSLTALDNINWENELWLAVEVNDEIMQARQRIVSVPFALEAQKAEEAETLTGGSLYVDPETGNVGIGTNSPEATLDVRGDMDTDTKLLLHFNSDFTDETGKTVTANGNAQIDTAQYKFGGASGLFDGAGDYLSLADHDDWYFGSGDFTIDFWIRFKSYSGGQGIISQQIDSDNRWYINKDSSNHLVMYFVSSGVVKGLYTLLWTASTETWYHLAFVRNGTSALIFINGISQSLTEETSFGSNDVGNLAAALHIGDIAGINYFNGWIDELRISKGIACWKEDFPDELPTKEYVYGGGDAIFAGDVKANSFIGNASVGDITFNKNGETLWRMFEEENGLYLESAKTEKIYKILMEEIE